MRRIRERLARAGGPDAGISLAELLVSMMITALLLTMTAGFMVSAYRANAVASAVDGTTREASTAMTEITRSLRAAGEYKPASAATEQPAFVVAGPTSMTLYAYINLQAAVEAPVRVQFSVVRGVLTETRWVGQKSSPTANTYSFPTQATSTTRLTSSVITAAPAPAVFTYLDESRQVIPFGSTGEVAAKETIAYVTVNLLVGPSATSTSSTLLTNTVSLTNLALWRETP